MQKLINRLTKMTIAVDTGKPFHYRVSRHFTLASGENLKSNFQWLGIINCAVIYNLIFVIGRAVFWNLQNEFYHGWLFLDYTCDFLYIIDIFIRMHEGIFLLNKKF